MSVIIIVLISCLLLAILWTHFETLKSGSYCVYLFQILAMDPIS